MTPALLLVERIGWSGVALCLVAAIEPGMLVFLVCVALLALLAIGAGWWTLQPDHEADQPPSGEATPAGPESTSRRPNPRG